MTQECIDINILDRVLDEINELKEFKKLYEYQQKDKERMSEELYELMMYRYNTIAYEQRSIDFQRDTCRCCRYEDSCDIEIPKDILEPIRSDKGWIPALRSCGQFEWN